MDIREHPTSSTGLSVHPDKSTGRPGWLGAFIALRHYNFRLYFIGLLISVTGMWAQEIAQGWLVYQITNSAAILGQVTFVMAIPVWLLSPVAGVVIDRTPRRMLLFITQTVMMLQAFALAALTFSGHIEVWHIYVLSAVRGIANAFDAPTRQAFYVELVDREDLPNAIALNSTLMSMARIVGPSLGGVVVAALGTAWAFTVNGVTFLAILISLSLMKLKPPVLEPSDQSPLADLMEGMRFIWQRRVIGSLMALVLAVAMFGLTLRVLLPVIVQDVLGRGEVALGMLSAASGIGSLIGVLMVSYVAALPKRGRIFQVINVLMPITMLAFAASGNYTLALVTIALVGIFQTPQMSLTNILIQSNIPDAIRGRVMAVYTLVIFGTYPVGSLLAGIAAEHFGAPLTVAGSAVAVLLIVIAARLAAPELKEA